MRPSWQAILLISIVALSALTSGWNVLYVLTYVLLSLFVLCWLWAYCSVRKLVFHRAVMGKRTQVGEEFEERLTVDNLGVLPKLWVQIADGSTLPDHRAGYVTSIGRGKRITWHARSICKQRGCFRLGPVTAISGDPFGLFRRHISLAPASEMLVLPRILPISSFALFPGGLPGRGPSTHRAMYTTTNAATIREYITGDPLSRIHWRSTAHFGTLMVKEFDVDPAMDAWLILDLQDAVQAGEGEHSTEECGVTIAATLATYLLRQGLSVGMIVNGEKREYVALDRGERQVGYMLEILAVIKAGSGPDLNEILDTFHLERHAVAIVITPSNARDWHERLHRLQRQGGQVKVVHLEAPSACEDTSMVLKGTSIPVLRVNCGEPLAPVLESGYTPIGGRAI